MQIGNSISYSLGESSFTPMWHSVRNLLSRSVNESLMHSIRTSLSFAIYDSVKIFVCKKVQDDYR
jgi:hypothetical protein